MSRSSPRCSTPTLRLLMLWASRRSLRRTTRRYLERRDSDGDHVPGIAIGEPILALLLFLVASAIMSSAKWAQLFTAIVIDLRMVGAGWWMTTHFDDGLRRIVALKALVRNGSGHRTVGRNRTTDTRSRKPAEHVLLTWESMQKALRCNGSCLALVRGTETTTAHHDRSERSARHENRRG